MQSSGMKKMENEQLKKKIPHKLQPNIAPPTKPVQTTLM
jgi:hypothetical protein